MRIYEREGGAWVDKGPPPGGGGCFGPSVAIDGDRAVVGAICNNGPGQAYTYRRTNGQWALDGYLSEPGGTEKRNFGTTVAIAADTVLVSTHDIAGRADSAVRVLVESEHVALSGDTPSQ